MVRLNGYPVLTLADYHHSLQNQIGCGIHTDYGEWIPATPIPGTFVSNIGAMLKGDLNAAVEPLEVWWKTDK
ncbi:putative 2-oxoglutarate-dependent dioxygenase [Gossypium australe]|uniref:Putative 2-oxoglutarate-dependent dioxygenase n=1 Tax=Gossypium australe TaxID=47621 RepID=A0A5B6VWZ1_9ROSI|nr:putative 2-oxoglutarate-dependent dioxygenase [Gossypium australe]